MSTATPPQPPATQPPPARGDRSFAGATDVVATRVATVVAVLVMLALFGLDYAGGNDFDGSLAYPVVLVACFWARTRRALWGLCVMAVVLTFASHWTEDRTTVRLVHRLLMVTVIVVLSMVFDLLMRSWDDTLRRQELLEASNAELAAREEEIARQNEELQSQTEELERQSEELTVANEELARRERSLAVLLELSRGLTIETTRGESLSRICATLQTLFDGPDTATAILTRDGDRLRVECHNGFGPAGLRSAVIPVSASFASLVFSHGRTGFLEDLSLRPDLTVPQPMVGAPMVSVISTPLKIDGRLVGAIEGYGTQRRAWTAEQVALIESLANQTAGTLRAEDLFDRVRRERQKFEAVVRTAPVGVAIIDATAGTVRYNPTGGAMLGLAAETDLVAADVSRQVRFLRDGKEVRSLHGPLTDGDAAGEIMGEEVEAVLPNGRRLTLLVGAAPLPGAADDGDDGDDAAGLGAGARRSFVSAFLDITQLKELQRELDVRRRAAEEASVRKTRFLAAVSHDVRTPANAISLLAELIRRTANLPGREAEIAEMAKELHGSAMALVSLLGDVLDVTRFDTGRVELQESEFDLRHLLGMEVQHLQPLAREKDLPLSLADGPSLWVRADKVKLARIVGNLAGNAIKFTSTGQVRVAYVMEADGRVRVDVSDTGVGIGSEHLSFIFDEFFQLRNPERDRNKGNGLGLTICKRLADAMGAELKVTSEPGRGSTFTLLLPATAVISRG